ncbi:hypothetical protein NUU61_007564 [Penicillium alfredii]|uniref:DUF5872 domain-containing protein n=1 Tax=Penicillium alfredii TaxID=1506179 RepID=A0A9W9EQQ0_9EURO|nr:uncharacterized protein NUU61_007564 [Penicillium alfredii]KAJ5086257.1 hypothetical protein NUU61_007564 [Penicillium alfredii]
MPSDKYINPDLRDQIKQEIHGGDKGGKTGQWSARKAQLVASEYKKRGGNYTTSKDQAQDASQKHLDQWTKEEWQTQEGSGTARQADDTRKRYLPKQAWEAMSNTEKARSARRKASDAVASDNQDTSEDEEQSS